ncbi:MAG TPA: PEP-CTERM sorting domain-containing protein [Phycisphaerae bacterium]|nr:PEP-CTERM sorting domain-containing protein [Phycisphaerae bacterium]
MIGESMQGRIIALCTLCCAVLAQSANANPLSDFDDGTLQGWTAIATPWDGDPFGGTFELVTSGGNPGGYIHAIDESSIGGLLVAGPAEFSGDLSGYTAVQYDEYIYSNPQIVHGTSLFLLGANGTSYRSIQPLDQVATWATRTVPLEEGSWMLNPGSIGTESFAEVLLDATLAVEFSVSVTSFPTLEAGIDNITLVPEPASLALLGLGGIALFSRRRR